MGLQRNLMKETVSTVLTHVRTVIGVLLLQMIVEGGRIAIRMRSGRLRLEVAEMTHQVTIRITLVANHFLLRKSRHGRFVGGVCRPYAPPRVQILRPAYA